MLCLQAFAKRLNHIGIRASCVGDVNEPPIGPGDLLVVASGSGESIVPVSIAQAARRLGARVLHIGANPRSSLAPVAHRFVRLPAPTKLAREGEPRSRQPMTNRFDQALYLFCDVVAIMVMARRGTDPGSLWKRHANLE
jgi:6-phospho-3-hexuloisomerase